MVDFSISRRRREKVMERQTKLSAFRKWVLTLRDEGFDNKQIADLLAVPESTIRRVQ